MTRLQWHVERVVEPGHGVDEPGDGVNEPAGRGGVPARGPVLALVGGLDGDLDPWPALDDHAVGAGAAGWPRPVRRAVGVNARDVLDDDPRFTADDALDLEPHGTLCACLEVTHGAGGDGLLERPPVERFLEVVQ